MNEFTFAKCACGIGYFCYFSLRLKHNFLAAVHDIILPSNILFFIFHSSQKSALNVQLPHYMFALCTYAGK